MSPSLEGAWLLFLSSLVMEGEGEKWKADSLDDTRWHRQFRGHLEVTHETASSDEYRLGTLRMGTGTYFKELTAK